MGGCNLSDDTNVGGRQDSVVLFITRAIKRQPSSWSWETIMSRRPSPPAAERAPAQEKLDSPPHSGAEDRGEGEKRVGGWALMLFNFVSGAEMDIKRQESDNAPPHRLPSPSMLAVKSTGHPPWCPVFSHGLLVFSISDDPPPNHPLFFLACSPFPLYFLYIPFFSLPHPSYHQGERQAPPPR